MSQEDKPSASVGGEAGWFLPHEKVSHLTTLPILLAATKRARYTNAVVRKDGRETIYEADWIKFMEWMPAHPSPDQEVMRGALEALEGLMELERRGRLMPIGREWDAARAAIASLESALRKEQVGGDGASINDTPGVVVDAPTFSAADVDEAAQFCGISAGHRELLRQALRDMHARGVLAADPLERCKQIRERVATIEAEREALIAEHTRLLGTGQVDAEDMAWATGAAGVPVVSAHQVELDAAVARGDVDMIFQEAYRWSMGIVDDESFRAYLGKHLDGLRTIARGVALPGEAYGTQALGRGFFNAEPAKCKTCGGTWSQHDAKGRCPSGVPAHSKSEYKRRVAQGDANALPPNRCELTECQGKPRCQMCLAMDARYGTPGAEVPKC